MIPVLVLVHVLRADWSGASLEDALRADRQGRSSRVEVAPLQEAGRRLVLDGDPLPALPYLGAARRQGETRALSRSTREPRRVIGAGGATLPYALVDGVLLTRAPRTEPTGAEPETAAA